MHESEDVAQEAFAQFHRRHPSGAPFGAAWVRRAALHLALNALRTRRRRDAREAREALASIAAQAALSEASAPAEKITEGERKREVRAVMARLNDRHAAVLSLRYSGMSYAEVAAAIGVPVAQIGTLLRRAEAAFKKEFEHEASR